MTYTYTPRGVCSRKMTGIHCGPKPTSCPDQMAHALEEALAAERA